MLDERRRLEKKIKSLDLEIDQLPEQNFYCTKNGKHFKWYESDNGKSRYIPKKQRKRAERLAKKKYLSLLRQDLILKMKAIDSFLKYQNSVSEINNSKFCSSRNLGLVDDRISEHGDK